MQRNLTPRSRRLFMTSPPTAPVPPITNTFITTSTITQRSHRANRGSKKLTRLHRSAGANQARTLAFITKQNQAQNITITTHIRHAVAHAGTVAVKENIPSRQHLVGRGGCLASSKTRRAAAAGAGAAGGGGAGRRGGATPPAAGGV